MVTPDVAAKSAGAIDADPSGTAVLTFPFDATGTAEANRASETPTEQRMIARKMRRLKTPDRAMGFFPIWSSCLFVTQVMVLRRLILNPQIVTLALRFGQVFFAACARKFRRRCAARWL